MEKWCGLELAISTYMPPTAPDYLFLYREIYSYNPVLEMLCTRFEYVLVLIVMAIRYVNFQGDGVFCNNDYRNDLLS